ncbi:hypothetical protein [Faecalispora jeddahensis]|uniref:hypothetical protein n=1 Tax=Faecalispora jeddahensis TaxID=1414721 RepID=UPI00189A87FA|nr:hypothetical protein [Faecalispora jeddahensis]
MRKRMLILFSCLTLVMLFSSCQSKEEEPPDRSLAQHELAGVFIDSLQSKSGNYTVSYLYYPEDSNEQTKELIQAIANSNVKLVRWGITDPKKGPIEVTKRMYYYPLKVTYQLPSKEEESTIQIGIYEIFSDKEDDENLSKSTLAAGIGRVILDWEGIPDDLKEGASQPEEDNGQTVLDLLNAQS